MLVDNKTNSNENSIFFKAGNPSNDEFEETAVTSKRVAREDSKQLTATQQNNPIGRDQTNPVKSTVRKKVLEFFIIRDKKKEVQDKQKDPDYSPEAPNKRMKRLKPATSIQ